MRRLQFMLLFLLLFMPIAAYSSGNATALPYYGEYTDQTVEVDSWLYLDLELTTGDVLTGYFETHASTQGLDFFIADSTEYSVWVGGESATVYQSVTNMHTNYWSLTIPYSDTWYLVFFNDDSETVTFDAGVDLNGDETPFYSPSSYDYEEYGQVLENDEWWYLSGTIEAGSEISGHFSTFFSSDGVDFFICDEDNYDTWVGGGTADVYDLKEDYHQANIDLFTVPYTDTWYLVWSAVGEEDTVTISYGVDIETSGATGTTSDTDTDTGTIPPEGPPTWIFLLAGAVVVGLVLCVVCSKRKDTGPPPDTTVRRVDLPGAGRTIIGASQKDIVKGALKSYPRVTMLELAEILEMDDDDVRNITLQLIASGAISGTFNKDTGEFISKEASQVGRELRDSAGILKLPRCPNCGAPLAGDHVIGDRVECENCGVSFTV